MSGWRKHRYAEWVFSFLLSEVMLFATAAILAWDGQFVLAAGYVVLALIAQWTAIYVWRFCDGQTALPEVS